MPVPVPVGGDLDGLVRQLVDTERQRAQIRLMEQRLAHDRATAELQDQHQHELANQQDRRHQAELTAEIHSLKLGYIESQNEMLRHNQRHVARDMQLEISRNRNVRLILWFIILVVVHLWFNVPSGTLVYISMVAGVGEVCGGVIYRFRRWRISKDAPLALK